VDNDRLSNLEDDLQPERDGQDILLTIVQDTYVRDENDELHLVQREPTSYDESGEWRDIGDGRRMRVRYARY
jgi:hypothetical protein